MISLVYLETFFFLSPEDISVRKHQSCVYAAHKISYHSPHLLCLMLWLGYIWLIFLILKQGPLSPRKTVENMLNLFILMFVFKWSVYISDIQHVSECTGGCAFPNSYSTAFSARVASNLFLCPAWAHMIQRSSSVGMQAACRVGQGINLGQPQYVNSLAGWAVHDSLFKPR